MENNKKKTGRKLLYGEKTTNFQVVVPVSKKEIIREFVENLLKTYRTNKN